MSVEVRVYRNMNRCLVRYVDTITVADITAGIQQLIDDHGWFLPTLVDATDATRSEVGFRDVPLLLGVVRRALRQHGPRGPVAIASDQDQVYCGARMYAMAVSYATGRQIQVFRSVQAAEAWLCEREGDREHAP